MAKDILTLFVNEIMKIMVQKALLSFFMGPGAMMPGATSFTPGLGIAGIGGGNSNLLKAMNNQNRELQSIKNLLSAQGSPNVSENLGSRQLYQGIRNEREVERIRLGEDINTRFFK